MATVTNSDQQVGGSSAANVQSITTPGVVPTGTNTAVYVSAVGATEGATANYADDARYTNSSGGQINDYVGADQLLSYFGFTEAYAKIRGEVGTAVGSSLPIYVHWPSGNVSVASTAVFYSGVDQTTPFGTEHVVSGYCPSGTSPFDLTWSRTGLDPFQNVVASLSLFLFGGNAVSSVVEGADTDILQDAVAASFEARQVRLTTCVGQADAEGAVTLTLTVTPSSNDDFIRYSFAGNAVNDAAGGGSPATLIVGGAADREAAGGVVAAPGAAAVAAGGTKTAEQPGGLVAQPGAVAVQVGGSADPERAGAVVLASGTATVAVGGSTQREQAGGVIAAAGVQTIVAGGTAAAERSGALGIVAGATAVVVGGVADLSASGGHQVVAGVVGINLGGTAQRELVGGLVASIGNATLALGGLADLERPGGAAVLGGAVQLLLGGVLERQLAGGLHMVDGTAPVQPTWPAGGTARIGERAAVDVKDRIGGRNASDVDDRIGRRRAGVQKQRIG